MGEWTGYNANNDMDKRTKFAFDRLSKEDKKYIEDAWHAAKKEGSPLTNAELKSAVKIRTSRRIIKEAEADYNNGPKDQTKKDHLDNVKGIHKRVIEENKAAHQDSEFIQEANLLDKGIRTLKDAGENVGGGILKIARALDPFGAAHAATNQKKNDFTFKLDQDDSFINRYALAEEQMEGSNKGSVLDKDLEPFDRQFPDTVYDDIGQYANRKIPGLEVDHRQNTDLLNDYYTQGEHYITYEPQEAQTWLEKHNAAQREYNRVAPGANVTPWDGGGNITSAAVQGRRNEDWMNSIIGNYTMGIGGTQNVKQNLINKYGTVQQQQNFADAIARKTHSPHANYDYWEGQGVDRADITADVTGMYTDDSSGIGDIGDATSSASVDDSWGDMSHMIARGGMVKDAPRYRYAEGGIVNLLPKGAW